jgi:molybdopterin molybdotransferase
MISADQAFKLVTANTERLGLERVSITEALGRVLAEDIVSARDIPIIDNSAMDGFAVRSSDISNASKSSPIRLRVLETVGAGAMPTRTLAPGEAIRTMTGAPIAAGADAIVQVENTRGEDDWVEVLAPANPGNFIRPRGEDLKAGETVMHPGRTLRGADLGMLASLGRPMISAYRRPRVAIVGTGDELVDVDSTPTGSQVVNSSAYGLAGAAKAAGARATILPIARDTREDIRARLNDALDYDVILTTGGVSVGSFDYVKTEIDALGVKQIFHGVAQRPGRPLKFGTIGNRVVFGLPGNPVSTLVCFYLYARAAIRKMGGYPQVGMPRARVRCAVDIRVASDLTEFVRVKLSREGDVLVATPTGAQGSGIFSSMSRADALLVGPSDTTILRAGDYATVLLLDAEAALDVGDEFELPRRHMN